MYCVQSCDRLQEAVLSVDNHSDVRKVEEQKGTGPHQPDQILPDYFVSGYKTNSKVNNNKNNKWFNYTTKTILPEDNGKSVLHY